MIVLYYYYYIPLTISLEIIMIKLLIFYCKINVDVPKIILQNIINFIEFCKCCEVSTDSHRYIYVYFLFK